MEDSLGLPLSGANDAGLRAYQSALDEFRCFTGDPVALADQAISAAPGMPMAHLLKAWLYLLGTEPAGQAIAREACAAAARLELDERERMHLEAAQLLVGGHWSEAGRVLEDLTLAWPLDLFALQTGHQVDFFTGDSRMLRDRIARALPSWSAGAPGYHAMLSMHAFGLEETGDYAQAERQGRRSVELEPSDGWGWHAVAHVLEMRNDPAAGVAWLEPNAPTWSDRSFFAVHNWWHLALFHLESGQQERVLELYDRSIATGSVTMLDLVDATAMLWRLQLRGVDVGGRWEAIARSWDSAGVPGQYAFNDMHMMMAFVGAGYEEAQERVLNAQREALARDDDNATFTRLVGDAATRAVHAFGRGDFATSVRSLRGIRSRAQRFGGSHAQRDVLDLTLIGAAERGGQERLAAGLWLERLALRPRSRQVRRLALAA